MRPKIVRLFGKADSFDLEFAHVEGGLWQCRVPPDTDDGVYAVELTAINELGETAYWTGELYMCGGVCHLKIFEKPFVLWFAPINNATVLLCNADVKIELLQDSKSIDIKEQIYKLFIRKGCCHVQ